MNEVKLPLLEDDPSYLSADDIDLYIASHKVGSPCPFCGSGGVMVRPGFNKISNLFGYHADCNGDKTRPLGLGCLARVSSGGFYTRDEARDEALKRWEMRGGVLPDKVPTSAEIRAIIEKQGGIV